MEPSRSLIDDLPADQAPPRANGEMVFAEPWEARAFGIALALSADGHYEWESFRQSLIRSIGRWESAHAVEDAGWSYYERWLEALENMLAECELVVPGELDQRTEEFTRRARDEAF
ncbi:MAG: nitrile hydratase accessory protein [Pseudonocardiaceae bacterium]|nr:nitrile hydratase accessory protein [Pseudonocardiaceae bacterium]